MAPRLYALTDDCETSNCSIATRLPLINATSAGITSTFNTDKAKGQASFAKLVAKNPDVARATLDRLKRDKSLEKVELQQLERILAGEGVEEGVGLPVLPRTGLRTPRDIMSGIKKMASQPSDLEGVLSFSGRDR